MASLLDNIRKLIWRFLGTDFRHFRYVVDYLYFKEDNFSHKGHRSYDHNALIYRWSDAPVEVGKYTSIADSVRFIVDNGEHFIGGTSSYPFLTTDLSKSKGNKKGIKVGNDVWIGQCAIIMPGVTIGDGVTVAAGSIVTKDIPAYTVVAGVPAKIIEEKCSPEEAAKMSELAWWDWPDEKVDAIAHDFALSIPDFLNKYYNN